MLSLPTHCRPCPRPYINIPLALSRSVLPFNSRCIASRPPFQPPSHLKTIHNPLELLSLSPLTTELGSQLSYFPQHIVQTVFYLLMTLTTLQQLFLLVIRLQLQLLNFELRLLQFGSQSDRPMRTLLNLEAIADPIISLIV
jgi:hypothetical protein